MNNDRNSFLLSDLSGSFPHLSLLIGEKYIISTTYQILNKSIFLFPDETYTRACIKIVQSPTKYGHISTSVATLH